MNKYSFCTKLLLLFSHLSCFHILLLGQSENYISYYALSREADICLCKDQYQEALDCYHKAIALVDYPRRLELHNAIVCCAILNEPGTMLSYMEMLMKQGIYSSKYEEDSVFAPYREMPEWKMLQEKKEDYLKEYEAGLNTAYRHLLDSLDVEDQRIRKKKSYWPDHFPKSERPKKYVDRFRYVDSCNAVTFDQLYQRFGYPCTRNIGLLAGSPGIGYLCLHHRRDSAFMDVQYQAVREGKIPLHTMDYKIRYANGWQRPCRTDVDSMLLTYYVLIPESEEERDLVNNLRKEKGFPSLEEEIDLIVKSSMKDGLLSHSHWADAMIRKRDAKADKKR